MYKKLRVLLVRNAFSYDFGGGERYPVYLAMELKKHQVEPIVASAHTKIQHLAKQSSVQRLSMPWLKNQNLSGIRSFLFPLYLVWQIRLIAWYLQTIRSKHIDVLHLQSRDDFIAGTIAGRILRKKVIWTDHADLKYLLQNLGVVYKNPVAKLIFALAKHADSIIVVSKNELSLIREALNGKSLERFIVIYNGTTDMPITPKREYSNDTTVFSLTSRLVDTKGINEVIDASKLLEQSGVNHKVVLIGEGPDKEKYISRAGGSVQLLGYPDDALAYVAGSDIFVHPTYNEAFSISLVEAAMLGMPVITTEVGGNPEIIVDRITGILVQPRDTKGLFNAMKQLAEDKSLASTYGANLRQSYIRSFQFDVIVKEQIIPLYNGTHEDSR